MKGHLKQLLHFNKPQGNRARLFGACLAMLTILLLSYLFHTPTIASFGSLGIFTFLYYDNLRLPDLIKRLLLVGAYLLLCLLVGILGTHAVWTTPMLMATIAFIGRFYFRLYGFAKPGVFFGVMVAGTGSSTRIAVENIPIVIAYFCCGIFISLLFALLVHSMEKNPAAPLPKKNFRKRLDADPTAMIDALFYTAIIFFAAYLSQGLNLHNPYWMVVSAAAILQANDLANMMQRNIQRILGTVIGLGIAAILLNIHFSYLEMVIVITLLFFAVEYFIPRNYAVANFFTTPLSLLLAKLATDQYVISILQYRFIGIFLGSILGVVAAWVMHTGLKFYQRTLHF
ncbi:FUSC family protein [Enterococcus sp. HY326]|uniref:FUSC family protein n=1 Tax=Enterococcus sp. HY326 TaxID=2971265 RepID=UPI00223F83B9|nr:FUSC family protein [Enterococcus sp. HY326]